MYDYIIQALNAVADVTSTHFGIFCDCRGATLHQWVKMNRGEE